MKSIWKPISGYEGRYEVSDRGDVRTINPTGHKAGILKHHIDRSGYHAVRLFKDGRQRAFLLARLVLLTFNGGDADRLEVNHKDGNKANNRLDNLEWVTRSENHKHAVRLGLKKDIQAILHEHPNFRPDPHKGFRLHPEKWKRGVDHFCAKLTEDDVRDIRRQLTNGTDPKIVAAEKQISIGSINDIRFKRTWRHVI